MIQPQLGSTGYQPEQAGTTPRGAYIRNQKIPKRRKWGEQLPLHFGLILWGLTCIFPLVWTLITSLKSTPQLYQDPFGLPRIFKWDNYVNAWVNAHMGTYFINSTLVTILSTIIILFVASTAAFALARFSFPFKGVLWAYILFGFLIPHSILLIPLAIFTRKLGVYDNLLGLAIIYAAVAVPWNTFFLRAFMETIPKELEEAAILDGAGMWGVYQYVIVPLSSPALATMATFHFLFSWGEFILALVLTGTTNSRTLPVGISLLEGFFTSNEPGVAAGMIITIIPVIIAFAFLQRYVIKGITAGALKG
jgi:raffinose/stachyose/melibiose transport system permease protein